MPGRALATGAEVVQIFSSNPRIWPAKQPEAQSLRELGDALRSLHLPLFFHAVYLINPASPDQSLRERSAAALAHALMTGALAGAVGVVTHLGSHRGEGFARAAPWIAATIETAWTQALDGLGEVGGDESHMPLLLLETAAGSGATVGGTLEELGTLVGLLQPAGAASVAPDVGLCLDTAHMFAAGYAVHQAQGLADVIDELEHRDLLRYVGLIHLNDSASLLGSRRDRHANPGEGELGYAGLAALVKHPALVHIPLVLEVPGSDRRGPGSAEIKTVKRMRQEAPYPRELPGDSGRGPAGPK